MLTDRQVRKLMQLLTAGEPLSRAALKTGMDEKTARRYRAAGALPSALKPPHSWRTRPDPFDAVWEELRSLLEVNPGLQATTLFAHLQRTYPARFPDGQLRSLQRRLKQWRATEGPPREVFFPQQHAPGELGASDFCHLTSLGVTIAGQAFPHLLYHFVLTYSNWETGSVCFGESFESLAEGLQQALFELGGVPRRHRTDSLSAAVHRPTPAGGRAFTDAYAALLAHYGLEAEAANPGRANENGDVEQRHYRFRTALDQALLLRGSRDFEGRAEYAAFLHQLFSQLNAGRQERLEEERATLRPLPATRLEACKRLRVRVGPSSTIRVQNNTYSVHSRLIGEWVEVRLFAEALEVWYGQRAVERLPRLRGRAGHRIDYRHVIDWLVRKPGAFANYRYRDELFPSSRFRIAYDALVAASPTTAVREYLAILVLSAKESEQRVEGSLRTLIEQETPISAAAVAAQVRESQTPPAATEVRVTPVDLTRYDQLLGGGALAGGQREAA
jgi:transposase